MSALLKLEEVCTVSNQQFTARLVGINSLKWWPIFWLMSFKSEFFNIMLLLMFMHSLICGKLAVNIFYFNLCSFFLQQVETRPSREQTINVETVFGRRGM